MLIQIFSKSMFKGILIHKIFWLSIFDEIIDSAPFYGFSVAGFPLPDNIEDPNLNNVREEIKKCAYVCKVIFYFLNIN